MNGFGNIIHNGIVGSVTDGIGEALESLLDDCGSWATDILNQGTLIYNRFLNTGYTILTKDINSSDFSDFWRVINAINTIFVSVGTTALTLFFLYSLLVTSFDNRREVNLYTVLNDLAKLFLCEYFVVNGVEIVTGIFSFGSKLAILVANTVSNSNIKVTDPERKLSKSISVPLTKGNVNGLPGLLLLIIAIFAAIIMIGAAVVILVEIYKRIFKMFCLIPFASISLSTAVLDDNHGNEVAKGYFKGICSCAFEAVVIVLCMTFCASLTTENSSLMKSLFNTEDVTNERMVSFSSEEEFSEFRSYARLLKYPMFKDTVLSNSSMPVKFRVLGKFDYYYVTSKVNYAYFDKSKNETVLPSGVTEETSEFMKWFVQSDVYQSVLQDGYKASYVLPIKVTVGDGINLGAGIYLILQAVFPMILTCIAVMGASSICSKVTGSM